jgi:hypothetical protein
MSQIKGAGDAGALFYAVFLRLADKVSERRLLANILHNKEQIKP